MVYKLHYPHDSIPLPQLRKTDTFGNQNRDEKTKWHLAASPRSRAPTSGGSPPAPTSSTVLPFLRSSPPRQTANSSSPLPLPCPQAPRLILLRSAHSLPQPNNAIRPSRPPPDPPPAPHLLDPAVPFPGAREQGQVLGKDRRRVLRLLASGIHRRVQGVGRLVHCTPREQR